MPTRTNAASKRDSQRLGSGEDPHLTAFGLRGRIKAHFAMAHQHQPGHALLGIDGEDRAFHQRQGQIFGRIDRLRASNWRLPLSASR